MIYALATLEITDPEKLGQYREHAAQALAKHGGAVVTAGAEFTTLEGDPAHPQMAALLSFPDKEAALNWINDPQISEVHALRRAAGSSKVLLLG